MSSTKREDLVHFHDHDIHLPSRTITFGNPTLTTDENDGEVDQTQAMRLIKNLHILDSSAPDWDKPITIIMNTPGGDWYNGMAVFDAIQSCKNEVIVIVYGMAMSMGCVILQAADTRILAPSSKIMFHYGYASVEGHMKTLQKWAKEYAKTDDEQERILLTRVREKNPEFTKERLKHMLDHDTILSAKEAVDMGLADKILGE